MPKLKTKKAAKKRFKFTKKGKIKRSCSGKGHILTKKTRKRKRALRKQATVGKTGRKMVEKLMPYG